MDRARTKDSSDQSPPEPVRIEPDEERPRSDEQLVARRAYRRFEERGGEHGRDVEDWLEAERELRGTGE